MGTVTGTWTEETGDSPIELRSGNANLTNSLKTSASYSKSWETENESPITENYLDDPISVTFALQVAELASVSDTTVDTDWTAAGEYFKSNLTNTAYQAIFVDDYGSAGYQF